MIPATNAAALDAMLASLCQRHGKPMQSLPVPKLDDRTRVLKTAP
jgi:hypothetical protein